MDRNLSFFLNAFTNKQDSRTGLPIEEYTYDKVTKQVVKSTNKEQTTGKEPQSVSALKSIMTSNKFVNYKGINLGNSPVNPFNDKVNDNSWASIIEFTSKYKSYALKPADLAYVKDVLVYPPNKLMVLRRFGNTPIHNDIINGNSKIAPTATLCGFVKPGKPVLNIGFNEVWVKEDESVLNIINDMIGLSDVKIPTIPGQSNINQAFLQTLSDNLGLGIDFVGPMGNPNIIHEAMTRKTNFDGESGWDGLHTDLSIDFETTYEMQYINGVDPGVAMLDIIANITEMGTSDSEFLLRGKGVQAAQKMLDFFRNPDVKELVTSIIQAIQSALGFIVDKIKAFAESTKKIDTAKNEDGTSKSIVEKVKDFGSEFIDFAAGFANDMIHQLYRKYEWKIRGSIYAMTGAPSTPWHITMGNPKNPYFICGNLVCEKVEMEFNDELGFNDMPTQINVKIKLRPARPLGKSEIQELFNGGNVRIHTNKILSHQVIQYR